VLAAYNKEGGSETGLLKRLKKDVSVIYYRKSWGRALPRLFLGFIATSFAVVPITIVVSIVGVMLYNYIMGQGQDQVVLENFMEANWPMLVFLVSVFYCWLYYVLFFRPALDRKSIKELGNRIKDISTKNK
jgi:phosphotransferase system  glucose/maltose/N-acetylglucosamine-specific IIC component